MTNEEKVRYWIALSDEDLNAGRTLFSGRHYLYVGFMCHQSLEKIFKACYTKLKEETPPYTHKLIFLAQQSGFYNSLSEEQKIIISEIEPLNIEARYPEYKSSMSKLLSRRKCLELFEQTNNKQGLILI